MERKDPGSDTALIRVLAACRFQVFSSETRPETVKFPAVHLSVEAEVVIGNDPMWREVVNAFQASGIVLGATVKNVRRQMSDESVAGEQVAAEEQIETGAEEPAMALGVSRQMNHLQTSPIRQLHACVNMLIDGRPAITDQQAPASFERSAYAAWPAIWKGSVNVRLLGRVRADWGAAELLNVGQVPRMIDVSVSEKNGLDIAPGHPDLLQSTPQQPHFAYEPGVDQDRLVARSIV